MYHTRHKKSKRFVPRSGDRPLSGIVGDASCLPVRDSIQKDGFFHGPVEWRVRDIATGEMITASSVFKYGNVNIAELMAIIDGVAWLHGSGDETTPVYSDSLTAIAWYNNRRMKSRHPCNELTVGLFEIANSMMEWLIVNKPKNPVLFWDNVKWGENPADYGRK